MLEIKNLSAGYGAGEVIHDISFCVNDGEILSITGANGCGKSTLLKTLAGHLQSMSGSILLDGRDMAGISPKALSRQLGCLNQANAPVADITVERLVSFGRVPYRHWGFAVDPAADRRAVDRAVGITGISAFLHRNMSELSGGERQRVWLAMALAQEPRYLLLDEPTTYLDMCHQLEILEVLKYLNQHDHITVVMVLHDLNQAIKYSHRIVIMECGRISAIGRPRDIMTRAAIRRSFLMETELLSDSEGNRVVVPMGLSDGSFLDKLGENAWA